MEDRHQLLRDERNHMEGLLNQRFNFFIVIFGLIAASIPLVKTLHQLQLLLAVGLLFELSLMLLIGRAQLRLKINLDLLREFPDEPTEKIRQLASRKTFFDRLNPFRYSVVRLMGYWLPIGLTSMLFVTLLRSQTVYDYFQPPLFGPLVVGEFSEDSSRAKLTSSTQINWKVRVFVKAIRCEALQEAEEDEIRYTLDNDNEAVGPITVPGEHKYWIFKFNQMEEWSGKEGVKDASYVYSDIYGFDKIISFVLYEVDPGVPWSTSGGILGSVDLKFQQGEFLGTDGNVWGRYLGKETTGWHLFQFEGYKVWFSIETWQL